MTTTDRPIPQIAIYWDFENIHVSLYLEEHGPRSYYRDSWQPALVDVRAIMGYLSSLGSVCVNRAYCNWAYFGNYAESLSSHAIELVQMFPRGGSGKNGADIQMCVDLVEDLVRRPHVDLYVIISGDSDFIGALLKVKQYGKRVIGIGVRGATHRFVTRVCDEFKFYDALLAPRTGRMESGSSTPSEQSLPAAKRLLTDALLQLVRQTGAPEIVQAMVKPMMIRLDSAFEEQSYGFASFTDFITACSDVVEVKQGEGDRLISLKRSQQTAISKELAGPRKLLLAAMTFLSKNRKEVPLAALKPMMLRLDPGFDETKIGFLSFLPFVRQFPDVVSMEGESSKRLLVLACVPDEGGYTLPVQAAPQPRTYTIPPDEVLMVSHRFHWDKLRHQAAYDWQDYYKGLGIAMERAGLPSDEPTLRSIQHIMWEAKIFRLRGEGSDITLRADLTEEALQSAVSQYVTQQRAAVVRPAGFDQTEDSTIPTDPDSPPPDLP